MAPIGKIPKTACPQLGSWKGGPEHSKDDLGEGRDADGELHAEDGTVIDCDMQATASRGGSRILERGSPTLEDFEMSWHSRRGNAQGVTGQGARKGGGQRLRPYVPHKN